MIKCYSFFAKWRQKDVKFLNSLGLNKTIEQGYDGFWVEEDDRYKKIIDYYSKKDTIFRKTKPEKFRTEHAFTIFSKEELNSAKYYALNSIGGYTPSYRYPQPNKSREYILQVFEGDFYKLYDYNYVNRKKQKAPFKIKKPKWRKNEVCFNLGLESEYLCFKKVFYQEVLAPLGLQCMEVIDYKTGKPLEDTVQLVIPTAKSKLLLEGSAYDIHSKEESRGYKQYAVQILDFFPPFEKDFDFHICYSQEYFAGGLKKIIISKEFCNLLVKHNIIEYSTNQLTPLKNK